jgi:hypothetical protein
MYVRPLLFDYLVYGFFPVQKVRVGQKKKKKKKGVKCRVGREKNKNKITPYVFWVGNKQKKKKKKK